MPRTVPSIAHLDMDAFFAAVEALHKPSLRGKPVIVGGVGGRGVVATASYEARAYGARSAMPVGEARRLCPPGTAFLTPRFAAYKQVSGVVMDVLRAVSPLVEPLSLDEAFVDLAAGGFSGDERAVTDLLARVKREIRERTGLAASVGAGTSKLMAKIASDLQKPDGLVVVSAGSEQDVLDPLPVRRLWGVGPATATRLGLLGVSTVGELRQVQLNELVAVFGGSLGRGLYAMARADDSREVVAEREAKSVSAENTFARDITESVSLRREVETLAKRVAQRLAVAGVAGRTVTVKVRMADFTTFTRSLTNVQPQNDAASILSAALQLTEGVDVAAGVRLLGVGVSGLSPFVQEALFLDGMASEPVGGAVGFGAGEPLEPGVADPVDDRGGADRAWRPGQDVHHAVHGPGWVWGAGLGRVTVRFEGPDTPPGPVRTFSVDDPELSPAEPPVFPGGGESRS